MHHWQVSGPNLIFISEYQSFFAAGTGWQLQSALVQNVSIACSEDFDASFTAATLSVNSSAAAVTGTESSLPSLSAALTYIVNLGGLGAVVSVAEGSVALAAFSSMGWPASGFTLGQNAPLTITSSSANLPVRLKQATE